MDYKKAYYENELKLYLENEQEPDHSYNPKDKSELKDLEFEKILEKYTALNPKNKPEIKNHMAEDPINNLNLINKVNVEEDNKNSNNNNKKVIDFENIDFENFDIYNFDFSKSIVKSNFEDVQSNAEKLKNNPKGEEKKKEKEKDFALYQNLEEYICDNNLIGIIEPKNLYASGKDEINKIKNFEDNFEEIIDEKNKIIQDLKKIILALQAESEEQKKISSVTKNELVSRIKTLKEKSEKLQSGKHEEIIAFYEKCLENTSANYLNFLKKLKDNWDIVSLPNLGGERENMHRVFQSMKIQINTLFKENEKLTKNLNEIKKTERMNHVYKNVISKFGEQIDVNRKIYHDMNKKQSEYVKELELQKQQLLEDLHEEKEKSRIDYQKLEDLSEKMKKYKSYEKEIALTGYLKKIENGKESNNSHEANLGITSYLSNYLNKSSSKPSSPTNTLSPSRILSAPKIYDFINSSPKNENKYSPIFSSPNFGSINAKNKSKINLKKNTNALTNEFNKYTSYNNYNNKNELDKNIRNKEKLEHEHNMNVDLIFRNTGINFEKTNQSLKNFSKIINASKIIFNEKLADIGKINNFFYEKLERIDVSLKMRFKRNTEIIKDTIDVLRKESDHLHGQFEKFFIIDVILNKLFFDVKIKFEDAKKTKNYTKFEIYMDKITSISSIQDIK